ncbi:MAG: TraR/DksA family transcriptional regulator [Pirellulaceae bacterium]|jgi:RNA polymerase-binding transcription factor DksA|nr:TraR/DksA family transcriptional regulator [Pirellulaceae bacterium]
MKKKPDLQPYKEQLLRMRARLRGDVTAMADATLKRTRTESSGDLSSMPIHMADIGSDNFEQEFTISLMQNDEGVLDQIEGALERIEAGTYGACVECAARIPKTRLNALPFTPYCIKCASELQRRY